MMESSAEAAVDFSCAGVISNEIERILGAGLSSGLAGSLADGGSGAKMSRRSSERSISISASSSISTSAAASSWAGATELWLMTSLGDRSGSSVGSGTRDQYG